MAHGKYWQVSFRSPGSQPGRPHRGTPAPVALVIPEEGQRPCARGEWCASSVIGTADGEARLEPALGYQAFCPRDSLSIARWLTELPGQYAHLAAELGKPAARGAQVRVPFGPRIPLRVDVDALMRAIAESLRSWHERVADIGSLAYPSARMSRRQRDGWAVQRAADVMGEQMAALFSLGAQPMRRARSLRDVAEMGDDTVGIVYPEYAAVMVDLDGADAGAEIISLRFLARAILGETRARPEELTGVPCRADGCGWRAVYRAELPSRDDEPLWWSECARCGDRMAEAEYREWTALCAAYERNRLRTPATLENLPGVA